MGALIVDDSRFIGDFSRGMLEKKGIACADAALSEKLALIGLAEA